MPSHTSLFVWFVKSSIRRSALRWLRKWQLSQRRHTLTTPNRANARAVTIRTIVFFMVVTRSWLVRLFLDLFYILFYYILFYVYFFLDIFIYAIINTTLLTTQIFFLGLSTYKEMFTGMNSSVSSPHEFLFTLHMSIFLILVTKWSLQASW